MFYGKYLDSRDVMESQREPGFQALGEGRLSLAAYWSQIFDDRSSREPSHLIRQTILSALRQLPCTLWDTRLHCSIETHTLPSVRLLLRPLRRHCLAYSDRINAKMDSLRNIAIVRC